MSKVMVLCTILRSDRADSQSQLRVLDRRPKDANENKVI